MHTKYDTIYLAPHLDDAALSCGGQIYAQTQKGAKILIVTIMAGDPTNGTFSRFAQALHDRWQLETEIVATRRREDAHASQILGADYQHGHIPDCIYRFERQTNTPLYPDWSAIIGTIHPQESDLIVQLSVQLATLPPAKRILAPLAVGNHVDHQIVRQAAELCFANQLFYYEDYPYVQTEGALENVIPPPSTLWQKTQIPLSPEALQMKAKGICAYKSQVSTFFATRQDLEAQLNGYAKRIGGERIWNKQEMT